ncbi:MAG: L,D-transpeptidase [Verrucomicrobiales bacterium]|nr:L,D-transpeptidase [Verrucomicrobiales bacterium]
MSFHSSIGWLLIAAALVMPSCSPVQTSNGPVVWHPISREFPARPEPGPGGLSAPQIPVPIVQRTTPVVHNIKPITRQPGPGPGRENTRIVVDIGNQRASFFVHGKAVLHSPVSTGRSGHPTPKGTFYITEKIQSGKISNIYHVEMPWWMRLDHSPFGLHAGRLPGYPASAGCVRLPADMARKFYQLASPGTPVVIR